MKSILLYSIFTVLTLGSGYGQIESFEGEIAGDTTFTVLFNLVDGIDFISTGDLQIEVRAEQGCDRSDSYLGTVTGDGGSTGTFGSIKVANPDETFVVSTSSSWCVFTGAVDGRQQMTGEIKFIGTLISGDSIEEVFTVVPNWPDNVFDDITFSADIWEDQELKELEIRMLSDIDYLALDNLVFENTVSTAISNFEVQEFIVYPNPTSGEIRLKGNGSPELIIVDAVGRMVRERAVYNHSIDISELPNGIYFIKLYQDNGQTSKRIIKI